MARQETAQDLRLAPGAQRRRRIGAFQPADALDHRGARHQHVVQRVVEFVDAAAQIGKRGRSGRHLKFRKIAGKSDTSAPPLKQRNR